MEVQRIPVEVPTKLYNGVKKLAEKQDVSMRTLLIESLLDRVGVVCHRSWKAKGKQAVMKIVEDTEQMNEHGNMLIAVALAKQNKDRLQDEELNRLIQEGLKA